MNNNNLDVEYHSFSKDGKKDSKGASIYNDKGDLLNKKFYHADGNKFWDETYVYEGYDNKGNWHKRKVFLENGDNTYFIEREITYFEPKTTK